MGIFDSIMGRIFQAGTAVEQEVSSIIPGAKAASAPPAPQPGAATPAAASPAAPAAAQPAAAAPAKTAQPVDVEAVLTNMASQKGGGGNWQTSIVDLLKLLDLDSSLQSRTQLAQELNVHAGANGSPEENVALHKAVMQKLAANGGMVPANLMG